MKKSVRLALGIGAVTVAFGLAAALWAYLGSRDLEQPSAAPERLTLAMGRNYIGTGLVLIATANGYFKEAGLEVTLQPHATGRACLEAVLAGKADLATVADTPLTFAALSGRPFLVVATIASEITDHGIVARKDRGIAAPADLKDKRIGVTVGTSGHFFLDVIKANYRIAPAPIRTLTNLQPEAMAAALVAGEVDAVSTWSPHLRQLELALGDNSVRFSGNDIVQYTFNLAGLSSYVAANPDTMKKLLRALERAEHFSVKHRTEARTVIGHAMGAGHEPSDERWADYNLRLTLEQRLLIQMEEEARWAIKNGYVEKSVLPNFLDFIYLDAMAAVKPRALTIIR